METVCTVSVPKPLNPNLNRIPTQSLASFAALYASREGLPSSSHV
ncbi:hypothetical protein Hanom_Chr09g00866451 [Helianthus anomalus]